MKLNRMYLIYLGVAGLIFVMGLLGGWWEDLFRKGDPYPTTAQNPAVPSINIYQTKLVGWNDHKKTWEIEAKRIWQSTDGNMTFFEKVSNGKIIVDDEEVYFTASWVRWEKLKNELYLGGGLTAKMDDKQFKTDRAVMNYQREELYCEKPVRLTGKDLVMSADTMKIHFKREELFLEGNVELQQDRDQVSAKGLWYSLKEERYHLDQPGGVSISL